MLLVNKSEGLKLPEAVCVVMPRSQIGCVISSKFASSNILDVVKKPYDLKTFSSRSHKSNGHQMAVSS